MIRSKLVDELYKILNSKFLLIGSNWKSLYPNALPSNYSNKYVENIYRGNVCIDFAVKTVIDVSIQELQKSLKVVDCYFSLYI